MIMACTCKHTFQDAQYGKVLRVHNWARKALGQGAWRCTVCGKEKPGKAPEGAESVVKENTV